MNLYKKIVVISICFISCLTVFICFGFFVKIGKYEKTIILKHGNNYVLLSKTKPFYNQKIKKYILEIHQNDKVDTIYLNNNQVISQNIHNKSFYLSQIINLKTYYNIKKVFYLKTHSISWFHSLIVS